MKNSDTNLNKAEPVNKIPARSRQAIDDLVDLSDYYTTALDDDWTGRPGVNLSLLPKGIHAYFRGAFDLRGMIQLAGKNTAEITGYDYPESVKGIKVNFKAEKIDFLQGTAGSVADDTKIGEYIIHYENGAAERIPIVYNQNVLDFTVEKKGFQPLGSDVVSITDGRKIYKYTVNNPLPDLEIKEIDFISDLTESAPFLIALTMETFQTTMEHEWFDSIRIYNDIIPRSPEARPEQIDLSDYFAASPDDDWFNHAGHDLHDLPKGIQEFGGVKFDVRGLLVLAGGKTSLKITGLALPEELKGIKINRSGKTVNFLHACAFDSERGTRIAEYIVHYANNKQEVIPVEYGVNVMDWWERVEEGRVSDAEEAWFGSNAASRRFGLRTRVIKYAWQNPYPDVEITKIDYISKLENSAPILFAITVV